MIGIGLIGYGYWGPNLARNLFGVGATIVAVSDQRDDRLVLARAHYPDVDAVRHWQDVIRNPEVDAVVIATPPSTHFQIALASLIAKKHVLVEKPITTSSDHARRLVDTAATTGLTLMVDHTYLYANSIQTIRHMIVEEKLGELQYYDSVRIGPRPPSIDVDVLWDLAAHDIAILDHILELRPEGVTAIGLGDPADSAVDDVSITFTFGTGFVSRVHVGWLAPTKIRRMLIGGSRRMISYDDMEPRETQGTRPRGGLRLQRVGRSAQSGWCCTGRSLDAETRDQRTIGGRRQGVPRVYRRWTTASSRWSVCAPCCRGA